MRAFKIIRMSYHVQAFRMQFYGSIFAYDEGFLTHSDAAMVLALWRNLFLSSPTASAQTLELALQYVRKNLAHLDSLPSSTVLRYGTPAFLPLVGDKLNADVARRRLEYCISWPTSLKYNTHAI